MALIHVPRPKNAFNPDRDMGSLLKAQVEHMQEAESKLPLKYRSEFYAKAARTEGEAAEYIRDVTEAIHEAHADVGKRRRARKSKRKFEIAAAADESGMRKKVRTRKRRATNSKQKKGRTK
ncbi:MAG TPA: hypothetical protein VGS27_33080 [Candidatus Sulfotelmatobacter sp.]|nr:hypothetical protein [Candidatus Sulfotelmatobacter sp.]